MITITDRHLVPQLIIDVYTSAIWHKKYSECGDFELYFPAGMYELANFKMGNFVLRDDDDMVGIIEKVTISQDTEGVDFVTVSGRDASAMLERRIHDTRETFYSSSGILPLLELANQIESMLRAKPLFYQSVEANQNSDVKLEQTNFSFGYGDDFYKIMVETCQMVDAGFKFTLDRSKDFKLTFYKPVEEKPVEFSAKFNNLLSSEYTEDITAYANKAIVAGEGEGVDRKIVTVTTGSFSSYDTKEVFIDARDLQSTTKDASGNDATLSASAYEDLLRSRGLSKLSSDYSYEKTLSCDIVNAGQYIYGTDYTVGDIVTISTPYTSPQKARVIGVTESSDENGHTFLPDLELI